MIEAITESKNGKCFEKRESYWIYSVCIGKRITQNAPNAGPDQEYLLGEFKGRYEVDELKKRIHQIYSDGGACQPFRATREVAVEYVCGTEVSFDMSY